MLHNRHLGKGRPLEFGPTDVARNARVGGHDEPGHLGPGLRDGDSPTWSAQRCHLRADRVAGLVLDLAEIVNRLEVEPHLRRGIEPARETQRGIGGDAAPSPQNLGDTRARDAEGASQLGLRYAELVHLILQNVPWMHRGYM